MDSLDLQSPRAQNGNTTPRQAGASTVMSMVFAIVIGVTLLMVLILPAPPTGKAASKALVVGDLKAGHPDAKHLAWVGQDPLTQFEVPPALKLVPSAAQLDQRQPFSRPIVVRPKWQPIPLQNLRSRGTGTKMAIAQDAKIKERNVPEVPAPSKKECEEVFDTYDTKKTGELGPSELGKILDDLGYSAVEQKEVFMALDLDGNGQVSKEEFCNNVRSTAEATEFYKRLSMYLKGPKEKGKSESADVQERGALVSLNSMAELEEFTAKAGETPVVVEFFAPWCRMCAILKPKYKQLARSYGDRALFAQVSVSKIKNNLKELGIREMPTFQVWKGGKMKVHYSVAGKTLPTVPKELAKIIDMELTDFSLLLELSRMDFDTIDADHSGTITKEELLETFDHDWSREKIEEAFNELDHNHDGGISREEFNEFCKKFGGRVAPVQMV